MEPIDAINKSDEIPLLHDQIAKIVCQHFNNLPKKGKPVLNEWTTLAAIVLSKPSSSSSDYNLTVVSCATGTKCLGKSELSPCGDVVSDSHAEVLARRSFLLFLLHQMKQCKNGDRNSILEFKDTASLSEIPYCHFQKFRLKSNVTFHLFVSQLPCGDAAIITSNETENEKEPESKRRKLDNNLESSEIIVSRTGAKLEVGPLVYEDIQTVGKCRIKPGKGDPTLSMSCSDKIAKWQILGLQGSLIGNFIPDPIRLSSIIIGGSVPFSKTSLDRAIFDRFSCQVVQMICPEFDFIKNYFKPNIFQSSNINFKHHFNPVDASSKVASNSSIVWHFEERSKQNNLQAIVNGRKQGAAKKHFGKQSAMVAVCRKMIFQQVIDLLSDSCDKDSDSSKLSEITYFQAKHWNLPYTNCWDLIKSEIMESWTTKPKNMQEFSSSKDIRVYNFSS